MLNQARLSLSLSLGPQDGNTREKGQVEHMGAWGGVLTSANLCFYGGADRIRRVKNGLGPSLRRIIVVRRVLSSVRARLMYIYK